MSLPDRIWAWDEQAGRGMGYWTSVREYDDVEYVRIDAHEALGIKADLLFLEVAKWKAEAERWAARVKELEARAERAERALRGEK